MIPLFKVHMSNKVFEPLKKVLKSGYIGQGTKVDEFEERLKEYFNNDYRQIYVCSKCGNLEYKGGWKI